MAINITRLERNLQRIVDAIIELADRPGRPIVLIERRNPPPGWALPGGFVDVGERVETAAIREAAGVAVANGLPWNEALRALTANPAKLWGMDDHYGRLARGQDAGLGLLQPEGVLAGLAAGVDETEPRLRGRIAIVGFGAQVLQRIGDLGLDLGGRRGRAARTGQGTAAGERDGEQGDARGAQQDVLQGTPPRAGDDLVMILVMIRR